MIATANCKGVYRNRTDLLKDGLGFVSPASFPCLVYLVGTSNPVAVCITADDIALLTLAANARAIPKKGRTVHGVPY